MAPLPSFSVTPANVKTILGNVVAGEIVGNAVPMPVRFVSNVPVNVPIVWDGVIYPIASPIDAIINGDGEIVRPNGDVVKLLANDPGLNVEGLQWTVLIGSLKRTTFDAGEDGDTLDLSSVVPVQPLAVLELPSLTVSGLTDATAFMKGMLRDADDAAEARTLLGLASTGDWEQFANFAAFPVTGNTALEYLAQDTNKIYRWNGSAYVLIAQLVQSTDITDSSATGRAVVTAADASAGRDVLGVSIVNTIAALRAKTAAVTGGQVCTLGYYTSGDGGGGIFRWDSTDTTSTDNGGTIITPSGGLASSGRWKRVYEGEVNARWFGMNPSQADNTAQHQAAITWVKSLGGGTVFIPAGLYDHKFSAGTSGLSTITVDTNFVLIRGEGKGTRLRVVNNARPGQVTYFHTFSMSVRGQGGGVRDLNYYGNSMLKWGIYLRTWRDIAFENVSAYDVHGGILDAESADTSNYGESVVVRHLDYSGTAGTTLTQYGVRFRTGASTSSLQWSDCKVEDLDIIGCWDSGLYLDGCHRFTVNNVTGANNLTLSDTIDGSAKTGCKRAVYITNSVDVAAGPSGYHVIDSVYLESITGTETAANNSAVWIEATTVNDQIQWNRISNVTSNSTATGLLRLIDNSGFGRLNNTTFTGSRRPATSTLVTIGAGVTNTYLNLTPAPGVPWSTSVTDAGTNTVINGGPPVVGANILDYGVTTGTSTSQTVAIKAALDGNPGKAFYFPPGDYRLNTGLVIANNNSLMLAPGARIYAGAAMSTLIDYDNGQTATDSLAADKGICGYGVLDGALLANKVLRVASVLRFSLEGVTIFDGVNRGLLVDFYAAEVSGHNLRFANTTTTNVSDNVAIEVNGSDCRFSQIGMRDWTIGVWDKGANVWIDVHPWIGTTTQLTARYQNSVAFKIAGDSLFVAPYADTYRYSFQSAQTAPAYGVARIIAPKVYCAPGNLTNTLAATYPGVVFDLVNDAGGAFTVTEGKFAGHPTTNHAFTSGTVTRLFVQNSLPASGITGFTGVYDDVMQNHVLTDAKFNRLVTTSGSWLMNLVHGGSFNLWYMSNSGTGTAVSFGVDPSSGDSVASANITTKGGAPVLFNGLAADKALGFATTATAAGTTTLTVASTQIQNFTGTTTQTVTLPTTSVVAGHPVTINNLSTGLVTVNSSGGTLVSVLSTGQSVTLRAMQNTPTTSAHWMINAKNYTTQWAPVDHGWTSWVNDPVVNFSGKAAIGAGYLQLSAIKIPEGTTTVTNLIMDVTVAGATLTSGQCKAALYQGGALLGTTADQSTAWTTTGVKTMALGSPATVTPGLAYVAWWFKGTTSPQMAAPISTGSSVGTSYNSGMRRGAWDTTIAGTLTTTAPSTLGALGDYNVYWAAIS